MHGNLKILALIPARGGSKGLPGKNLKPLAGKPLIAWTIEAACNSKYIDRVIVSTDDNHIAQTATKWCADVPFLRPPKFARDDSPRMEYINHALDFLRARNEIYEIIVILQPTSPLRTKEHIDQAIESLFTKNAQALVSVCPAEHPPYWMNTLPKDGCMANFWKQDLQRTNRQDAPQYFRLNGALYIAYVSWLDKMGEFIGDQTYAYIMEPKDSIDIDTSLDLQFTELIMAGRNVELCEQKQ